MTLCLLVYKAVVYTLLGLLRVPSRPFSVFFDLDLFLPLSTLFPSLAFPSSPPTALWGFDYLILEGEVGFCSLCGLQRPRYWSANLSGGPSELP